jgi:hypothetical protein
VIRTNLGSLIELTELYEIIFCLRGQEARLASTIFLETCMILTRKWRPFPHICQQEDKSFKYVMASLRKEIIWYQYSPVRFDWAFLNEDAQSKPKLPIQNLKPMNTQHVVDVATPEHGQEYSDFSTCTEHFNCDSRTLHVNGSVFWHSSSGN